MENTYYLGIGNELIKAQCKQYKTLDGAFKAAAKDESFVVWDEDGNVLTPPEDNTQGEDTGQPPEDNTQGEDTGQPLGDNKEPIENKCVTVICEGSLNLRRTPEFVNSNICGRAVKGQKFHAKYLHAVGDKKMVETIDGLFISADEKLIKIEEPYQTKSRRCAAF